MGFEELRDSESREAGVSADASSEPSDASTEADANFYVSPAGDDSAPGTREAPLRSIRVAVERAAAAVPSGRQRIAVCSGDYPERPIVLRGNIALQGGYDCTAWRRRAFDDATLGPTQDSSSVVSDVEPGGALLEVSADQTGSPLVDGLSLRASRSIATVFLIGRATISQSVVTNSSVPLLEGQFTTAAVLLSDVGGQADHCLLKVSHPLGTTQQSKTQSAYGLSASGRQHVARKNRVEASSVMGQATGILVLDGELDIVENEVFAFSSVNAVAGTDSAVGILALNSAVRSSRNAIALDLPVNTAGPARVEGIVASNGGTFASDGDRIVGPAALGSGTAEPAMLRFFGFAGDHALTRVTNASIYLALSAPFSLGESAAIRIIPSVRLGMDSNLVAAHNTIFLSGTRAPELVDEGPVRGMVLSNAMLESTDGNRVAFDSNLVFLRAPEGTLVRGRCAPPQFASVASNRYSGVSVEAETWNPFNPNLADAGDAGDAGARCPSSTVELADFALDGGASDNVAIVCSSCDAGADACPAACDSLVLVEQRLEVLAKGLQLTPQGCAEEALKVFSREDVPNDGRDAPRDPVRTYAGAFANCP